MPFPLPGDLADGLRLHVAGRWCPGEVVLREVGSTFRPTPQVVEAIARAWASAKLALGDRLFDGPMCRLEGFEAEPGRLNIRWSRTGYRDFLGTNMTQPDLPTDQRANPVGVSTALVTVDGWFMLGRRSGNVAYYPHRLHPFAGSLEPSDPVDLFAEARRELQEELLLASEEVADLALLGIVEDTKLNHPETILHARTSLPRARVEARMDRHEHAECWACPDEAGALARAINTARQELTPVALAAALLHGHGRFGADWLRGLVP